MATIDHLPIELLIKIFGYLDTHADVLLVNKLFYSIVCIMDGKVNLRINSQIDSKFLDGMQASCRNISTLRITGPSLKHMLEENHQTIIATIERFSASLRNLIISRVTLDVPTFLEILSFAPNIEHLDLCDIYLLTGDVGLLKKRRVTDDIELMELKSLSISGCDDEFVEAFDRLSEGVLVKLTISGFQWNVLTALLNRQSHIKTLELGLVRGIAPDFSRDGDTTVFDKLTLDSLILRGDEMSSSSTVTASILSKQTTLNLLKFQHSFVVDEHVFNALANLLELKILSMNFDKSIAAPFKNIGEFKKLEDLTMYIGSTVNAIDIFQGFAQCKGTSIAKVTVNGYVSALPTSTIVALARSWPHLKHLKIADGQLSLAAILTHFNFVEVLDIGTDDVGLVAQQNNFDFHVKQLHIRSRKYVSIDTTGLTKLSSLCRNLTKLGVDCYTENSRHIEIKPIIDACPELKSLTLHYRNSHYHPLIVDDWDYLVQRKTKLKFISVGRLMESGIQCALGVSRKLRKKFGAVEIRYGCVEAAIDQNELDKHGSD